MHNRPAGYEPTAHPAQITPYADCSNPRAFRTRGTLIGESSRSSSFSLAASGSIGYAQPGSFFHLFDGSTINSPASPCILHLELGSWVPKPRSTFPPTPAHAIIQLQFDNRKSKIENRKSPVVNRKFLILLVGPTAVGKTDLALHIAGQLDAEIVSADSRLFYRGMDIGTAKPSPEELSRVPHHLIDVADPRETWSLALFQEKARQAIAGIHARGRLPLLVGGTGQYVRAVTQGWTPPPTSDTRLRAELERLGVERGKDWLHGRLAALDAPAAEAIDPRNLRRTVRALEVILSSGRRFSEQRSQAESPYNLLTIGLTLPRPELYARIDARIEAMFAAGLLDEVRGLLERGCTPDLPSMSAIGYRECCLVLAGRMSMEEAKTSMRRLTRVFVRRQGNWFKESDPNIHWFDASDPLTPEKVITLIRTKVRARIIDF